LKSARQPHQKIQKMIAENSDIVALTAQADLHRLYVKVIQPALAEFAPNNANIVEEPRNIDEFWDNARMITHDSLCYELRRTFALVLGALFERQLRFWLSEKLSSKKKNVEKAKWPELVGFINCVDSSITTNPLMEDLEDLWLVANTVRHGNGSSAEKLLHKKPGFWSHVSTSPHRNRDLISNMRIDDAQIQGYAIAVMKLWHLAGASSLP
jgi:hypothetical protein